MSRLSFVSQNDLRQLEKLSTPLWIFDVDRHGIWWANGQGLAFWQAKSVAELQARDFSSDSTTVRDRLSQIVASGNADTHVTDTWTLYPGGNPQTVVLSFQPVLIDDSFDGVLVEIVRVLNRDSDDETWRLLEAARATSLMMTTFSLEGALLAQNPASLACYGAKIASEDGRTCLQKRFVDPTVAQRIIAKVSDNEPSTWEAAVKTAKGVRTHALSVRKGRDPIAGEFVIVLTEEDVTERVRVRRIQQSEKEALKQEVALSYEKLRISQERYELAVQTAAIWDWDVIEDRLFMSPNFVSALGYSTEEFTALLREHRFEGLLHLDDVMGYRAKLHELLANPSLPMSFEMRFVTKSGAVEWFHCQGKCVLDEFGRASRSAGLLTNITRRKQLEETLLASQRMEAIGQLTGGIAHDFNNLLTVIQGNAELLAELETTHSDLVSEIVHAVTRGADLTRHLLAFAGQQTLLPKPVCLNELLPAMKKTLLRILGETVTIGLDMPDDLSNVHVDPTQLEAAVLNMALNARDAMPSGGVLTITGENVTVDQIPCRDDFHLTGAHYVRLSVQDTGDGMDKETRFKAFEPFFTTKGVGQGSGLGLSMVQGFSRQSQGAVTIDSEAGMGTTVTLYLPQAHVLPDFQPQQPIPDIVMGKGERILILEDNPHVQDAVSRLVQALGYDVSTASDVAEASAWISAHPSADLYLVDIVLPGGQSGVDFAKHLRASQPDARILFMSGHADDHLGADNGLDFEVNFLSKPFDKAALAQSLAKTLRAAPVLETSGT